MSSLVILQSSPGHVCSMTGATNIPLVILIVLVHVRFPLSTGGAHLHGHPVIFFCVFLHLTGAFRLEGTIGQFADQLSISVPEQVIQKAPSRLKGCRAFVAVDLEQQKGHMGDCI